MLLTRYLEVYNCAIYILNCFCKACIHWCSIWFCRYLNCALDHIVSVERGWLLDDVPPAFNRLIQQINIDLFLIEIGDRTYPSLLGDQM